MKGQQFDLSNFNRNSDGSYTKKTTVPQPRDMESLVKKMVPLQVEMDKTIAKIDSAARKTKKQKKIESPVYFKNKDIKDVFADAHENNYIYIPGNVPSLKNSKQLFINKKTGKQFISSSDLCKRYVKETRSNWQVFKYKFLKMIEGKEKPYKIRFIFIRDKHKAFDYINAAQMPLDLMQEHGWIEDDDNRHIIPDFSEGFGYDPKLAGVIIKVI